MDLSRLESRIALEVGLVRGLTKVSSGPHPEMAAYLVNMGAEEFQHIVSPEGTAYGIELRGSTLGFAGAVATSLSKLTAQSLGQRVLRAFGAVPKLSEERKGLTQVAACR